MNDTLLHCIHVLTNRKETSLVSAMVKVLSADLCASTVTFLIDVLLTDVFSLLCCWLTWFLFTVLSSIRWRVLQWVRYMPFYEENCIAKRHIRRVVSSYNSDRNIGMVFSNRACNGLITCLILIHLDARTSWDLSREIIKTEISYGRAFSLLWTSLRHHQQLFQCVLPTRVFKISTSTMVQQWKLRN